MLLAHSFFLNYGNHVDMGANVQNREARGPNTRNTR